MKQALTYQLFLTLGLLATYSAWAVDESPLAALESYSSVDREHWAFQPVSRPDPATVRRPEWVHGPIDRFLLADLETLDLSPAPAADRVSLIRRLTFDLIGLPPTPEEVKNFLEDPTPMAMEHLVDRLMASPRYGERWAQHWLDLAHYADSNGFELDAERPDAWRYRDWVIRSLNEDLPFDQFLTLQLAGDESRPGDQMALIATGFGRCGPREVVGGNIDPMVRRQSEMTEVTGTVGSVFLGLTIGCARCHDHKFDPLPTTDYYRLQSFFAGAQFVDKSIATEAEKASVAKAKERIEQEVAPLRKAMAELEKPYREAIRKSKESVLTQEERTLLKKPEKDRDATEKKRVKGLENSVRVTWEDVAEAVHASPADHARREQLKRAIHEIEKTQPRPPASAMALIEPDAKPPMTRVLKRGDVKNPSARVEPRPPGILLSSMPESSFSISPTKETSGRRVALANWLTHPNHPLTARVLVNRLWQYHFGRGIVATPNDFGTRGEPPSNPELLDWLASELIRQGWRLKPIHRLIVLSSAYSQSSSVSNPTAASADPDNILLWRMNRRRLEAESLRDAMLAASGELADRMAGPGVLVPIEKEIEDLIFTEQEEVDLWPETRDPREQARRSIYLFRKRNVRYAMFDAFDAPDTQSACPRRETSTHALQALVTLNSEFVLGRAAVLAGRALRDSPDNPRACLDRLYRFSLSRNPRASEVEQALRFLDEQAKLLGERAMKQPTSLATPVPPLPADVLDPARAAAWVDLALAMLNRNEFLYIP